MLDRVPTVTIVTKNGPVDINLSDYDPAVHDLATGEAAPEVTKVVDVETNTTDVETEVTLPAYSVGKNGKRGAASKFVVFGNDGNQVGEQEYETEEEAKAAIPALLQPTAE